MKLEYAQSSLDNTGSIETRKASISMNPTMMHVLSRDLYQRPIEALFREIFINAIDAHVKIGNDQPVDIHLPYYWDETFYIRDYGPGLSREWMMNNYLNYGYSEKRDNNEEHGGLGLGTKSPLAYTSSFAFTSYFNGMKYDYMVYSDEDNIPCIDLREESSTTEPNGIQVSLAVVKSGDIDSFASAARRVLARVPTDKYRITTENFELKLEPVEPGELIGNIELKHGKGIVIVMGYIAYDFDSDAVLEYVEHRYRDGGKFHAKLKNLLKFFRLEVQSYIGDYDIHPSREHINITPKNIKLLARDIDQVFDILTKRPESSILSDLMLYSCGELPDEKCELLTKVRVLTSSSYQYSRNLVIENQLHTYKDVLRYLSISYDVSRAIIKQVYTIPLSEADMIEYLGLGRRDWRHNLVASNQIYIFYDINNTDTAVQELISKVGTPLDLTEDIISWKATLKDRQEREAAAVSARPVRRITRSISDPTHNVLLYKEGNGSMKANWTSSKHNVQSLKELNKPVFMVPTRMGCVKDRDAKDLISEYADLESRIPSWKRPIVLGLPASRGTKMLEAAFQPISELRAWMDVYIASDYMQRRAALGCFSSRVLKDKPFSNYHPIAWFSKYHELFYKYKRYESYADKARPFFIRLSYVIKHYEADIRVKLPDAFNSWFNFRRETVDEDLLAKWIDTLNSLNPNWRL